MVVYVFAGCDPDARCARKTKRNRIGNNKDSPQEAARCLGVNFYAKKGKTTVYNGK